MSEGIEGYKVSLTKNGYQKLARLIEKYPKDEILDHLDEIRIDRTQAVRMLASDPDSEILPDAWDEVRKRPAEIQNALLFVSILFSHVRLVRYFSSATNAEMRGVLDRDELTEKVYTNLAFAMNEAGMIPEFFPKQKTLRYDLTPVFRDMSIGPLAREIIESHLKNMGWSQPTASEHWKRNLYEQCLSEGYEFHRALGVSRKQFEDWLDGNKVDLEAPPTPQQLDGDVAVSGTLVAALCAKRFAILAGTTGTGKTQTILRLAKAIEPFDESASEQNSVFIPVGAGWTDSRHLLGYKNPFGEGGASYTPTPLLRLLLKANFDSYKEIPFFVILDEMNLSYVELYFSKFLSLMEAAIEGEGKAIINSDDLELLGRSGGLTGVEHTYLDAALKKRGLFLSRNVFIVGTVNIDETTHNFSPKVLDRSFVLEYPAILPSKVLGEFSIPSDDSLKVNASMIPSLLMLESSGDNENTEADSFLDEVFGLLERFRFGPRVTNEARRYFNVSRTLIEQAGDAVPYTLKDESALQDNVMLQKILPKLHGNKKQLATVLVSLEKLAKERSLNQSLSKISALRSELESVGFSSFFSAQ